MSATASNGHAHEVEKMTGRVTFACSDRELRLWRGAWGINNLSKTIRLLLNAAAAQRRKRNIQKGNDQ